MHLLATYLCVDCIKGLRLLQLPLQRLVQVKHQPLPLLPANTLTRTPASVQDLL